MKAIAAVRHGAGVRDPAVWLGVTIGFLMPVVSAALYPTYMHQMQPAWAEWTRLMELPFVACELMIIHLAMRRGFRDVLVWESLPRDIKLALGLLAVGLVVGSVGVSRNPAASITLSIITVVHLRFASASYFLFQDERRAEPRAFLILLALGLVLLTVLTAWKFSFPPLTSTVPGGAIEWPSALPGFISVRHFGSWTGAIAAGLMVSLLYGSDDRTSVTRLLYLLAAGLTCWSGTRGAVLAMAVVALVMAVSLRRMPGVGRIVSVGALSVLAFAAAVLLAPNGEPEFALFHWGDYKDAGTATSGRLDLWHDTFMRWLDAPIFGLGSGSTFWEVNIGWAHTQPHNVILQFLISWGLVGAAGGLWLLARAIVAVHRPGVADARLRPLTGMLYALLFMSLIEGMLYYPRFIMAIMIGFAMLMAERDRPAAAVA